MQSGTGFGFTGLNYTSDRVMNYGTSSFSFQVQDSLGHLSAVQNCTWTKTQVVPAPAAAAGLTTQLYAIQPNVAMVSQTNAAGAQLYLDLYYQYPSGKGSQLSNSTDGFLQLAYPANGSNSGVYVATANPNKTRTGALPCPDIGTYPRWLYRWKTKSSSNAADMLHAAWVLPVEHGQTSALVPAGQPSDFTAYLEMDAMETHFASPAPKCTVIDWYGSYTHSFTGTFGTGTTSGTLGAAWPGFNGTYSMRFSNGDTRNVLCAAGSTTISWSGGLSGTSTSVACTGPRADTYDNLSTPPFAPAIDFTQEHSWDVIFDSTTNTITGYTDNSTTPSFTKVYSALHFAALMNLMHFYQIIDATSGSSPNGTASSFTVYEMSCYIAPATGLTVLPPPVQNASLGRLYTGSWRVRGQQPGSTLTFTDGGTSADYPTNSTGQIIGASNTAGTQSCSVIVSDGTNSGTGSFSLVNQGSTGALAVSYTPPDAAVGGGYHSQIHPSGDRGPYASVLSTSGASSYDTVAEVLDGWVNASPTSAATTAATLTCTSALGNTTTAAISFHATTTMRQYGVDETSGASNRVADATFGCKYQHRFLAAGGAPTKTLTTTPGSGATSATLLAIWAGTTGSYDVTFNNLDTRVVTITNGSAALAWTGGLSSSAGSSTVTILGARLISGALPAGMVLSGASLTGAPSAAGSFTPGIAVTDGINTTSTVVFKLTVAPAYIGTRPTPQAGWTAGGGFFYDTDGDLCDPNGRLFFERGGNSDHFDDVTDQYIQRTQCNSMRINFAPTVATATVSALLNKYLAKSVFPWYSGFYLLNGSTVTSGNTSLTSIGAVLNYYCNTLIPAIGTLMNASCGFNLFNEFNYSSSGTASVVDGVWRDATMANFGVPSTVNVGTGVINYTGTTFNASQLGLGYVYLMGVGTIPNGSYAISASSTNSVTLSGLSGTWSSGGTIGAGMIGMTRAAGYTGPIAIDAPGYGQQQSALISYAATVFASDPLANTTFAYHLYGQTPNFEVPVTNVSAVGATTSVRYSYADALNQFEYGQNGNASCDPFKQYAAGTATPSSLAVTAYGFGGLSGINGQSFSLGTFSGTYGAYTGNLTGNTTSGTWTAATGYLYCAKDVRLVLASLGAIRASQNIPIKIEEFGPAVPPLIHLNASPGPTPPLQVIQWAEANNLPWNVWATDDGTGSPANSLYGDYALFGFGAGSKGVYLTPSNLTANGRDVVNHPVYGWQSLASFAPALLP